jgi:hypothetical protein
VEELGVSSSKTELAVIPFLMICGIRSTVGPEPFNWVGFGIVEVPPVAVFGATMYAVDDDDI